MVPLGAAELQLNISHGIYLPARFDMLYSHAFGVAEWVMTVPDFRVGFTALNRFGFGARGGGDLAAGQAGCHAKRRKEDRCECRATAGAIRDFAEDRARQNKFFMGAHAAGPCTDEKRIAEAARAEKTTTAEGVATWAQAAAAQARIQQRP